MNEIAVLYGNYSLDVLRQSPDSCYDRGWVVHLMRDMVTICDPHVGCITEPSVLHKLLAVI